MAAIACTCALCTGRAQNHRVVLKPRDVCSSGLLAFAAPLSTRSNGSSDERRENAEGRRVNEKHEIRRGSLWMIAFGAALWGLDALFILALQHWLTSIEIVCFEHALLALFAVPVLVRRRREWLRLIWTDWFAVIFVAWGGSAVASILFNVGLAIGIRSDAVTELVLLQKLQPVFALLLAALTSASACGPRTGLGLPWPSWRRTSSPLVSHGRPSAAT